MEASHVPIAYGGGRRGNFGQSYVTIERSTRRKPAEAGRGREARRKKSPSLSQGDGSPLPSSDRWTCKRKVSDVVNSTKMRKRYQAAHLLNCNHRALQSV